MYPANLLKSVLFISEPFFHCKTPLGSPHTQCSHLRTRMGFLSLPHAAPFISLSCSHAWAGRPHTALDDAARGCHPDGSAVPGKGVSSVTAEVGAAWWVPTRRFPPILASTFRRFWSILCSLSSLSNYFLILLVRSFRHAHCLEARCFISRYFRTSLRLSASILFDSAAVRGNALLFCNPVRFDGACFTAQSVVCLVRVLRRMSLCCWLGGACYKRPPGRGG